MLLRLQIWLADHFACFQYPPQEYAPHGLPSQWKKCGTSRSQRLMVFFASWTLLVLGVLLVAASLFVIGPLLAV